jgi:hypothetical protein
MSFTPDYLEKVKKRMEFLKIKPVQGKQLDTRM